MRTSRVINGTYAPLTISSTATAAPARHTERISQNKQAQPLSSHHILRNFDSMATVV